MGGADVTGAASLRVLLIEDSEADADLLLRQLRHDDFAVAAWRRVDTAAGLRDALSQTWDLVTCDWKMPGFGAPEALAILAARGVDAPIVIVSGEVGEEFAVTAMRTGAHDFVSKERLFRLGPAVERGLREAEERRARRRAEEALQRTEMRFSALIENTSDQVAVIDAQGRYLYASPSHQISCGYTPAELFGTNAFELLHPDDVPAMQRQLAAGLQTGQRSRTLEFRVHHKDGSWRTIEASVQNLVDDPAVGGLLINGRDITARRQMEDTLRLHGAIIANLPEAVGLARTSDHAIVAANPKFEAMYGYGPGELLGRHVSILDAAGQKNPLEIAAVRQVLDAGETWEGEIHRRRKNGSEFWSRTTLAKFTHPEHGAVWISIQSDVTAVRERLAMQRQLETIAATAPGVIFSFRLSPDGKMSVPYASPATREIYDLDPAIVVGDAAAFFARVPPDEVAGLEATIHESARTLAPWRHTFRLRHPRRGELWVEGHSMPQRQPDGGVLWHGFLTDVTERKRADEQAQRWTRVFETADFGLAMVDAESNTFTAVNPAFARQRGYQPGELIGRSLLSLYAPDQHEFLRQRIRQIDELGHLSFEAVHLRKDGSRLPFLMEVTAIRDANGKVTSRIAYARDISRTREAEETLSRSESRYRQLFHNMREGFALCRMVFENGVPRDFVYLDVNDAFRQLTGLDDVVGRSVREVLPGIAEDNPEVFEVYGRVVTSGRQESFEVHLRALDAWLEISAYAAGDECFVALFDNITARRLAEAQTKLQTTALQAVANAIVITDRGGNILWANPAFTKLTGYEVDEVIGGNPRLFKSGMQDASFYAGLWETIVAGRPWSGELVNRRSDGTLYREEMTITPVHAEDGTITNFIAVKQDITERKQAENRLHQSEQRLRSTMDSMLEGLQIIGTDWRYLYVNPAAAAHGRRRADELLGRTMMEMYPGIEHTPSFAAIARCMQGGASEHLETEFTFPDGGNAWFELSVHRVPEGVAVLSVDVSERKRAEEQLRLLNTELEERVARRTAQLEAANQELEAFSYSVSHDLRAPLRVIDGFSSVLLEDHGDRLPEEARQHLERIRAGSHSMGTLIEALLRLSRLGQQPLQRQMVDANSLARAAVDEVRAQRDDAAVEVHVGDLPACRADPTLLRQVWFNLLDNAFKYGSRAARPMVEVGARRENGETVYFVRDNGAGFDMNHAHKLFGVFQRLHRAAEFEGTGVGLAIVQRIVHRHGGRVWADAAVDQGATFCFTLADGDDPQ